MTEEKKSRPSYTGMKLHADRGGFSLWVPSDWYEYKLKGKLRGVIYSPYPDDFNTGIMVQKRRIKTRITRSDLPILREGFMEGIKALPGVEIEPGSASEYLTDNLSFFEVRFTFLEDQARRKRWVRNIYWGKRNYVLIAQGRTPEDFDYWLPMFYNSIMNTTV